MQCVSCQFENMPGVDICGRCGTSLRLATAVLDVHPPRAPTWRKRFRRVLPMRQLSVHARNAASDLASRGSAAAESLRVPLPERALMVRLIVPGWAHFAAGQPLRARFFLCSYLVLLAAGLLFWGSTFGSILLGLMFSVHASSAIDLLFQGRTEFPSRLWTAAVVMTILGLCIYGPAVWLLTRVAMPRTITANAAPFAAGDVVLQNSWAYSRSIPKPGHVVAFHTAGTDVGAAYLPGFRVPAGDIIDRIIAGPGSLVEWRGGQLFVDGTLSSCLPLNAAKLPGGLSVRVPAERYLIFPTTVPNVTARTPTQVWQSLSCVPASDILGRIYLRNQPLNRFGLIR